MIRKKVMLQLVATLFALQANSQSLTQTVRGVVLDTDSKMPMTGVQVLLLGSDPLKGAVTNLEGEFRLENVPLGRASFRFTYMGYQAAIIPDISVISGKESVITVHMQESLTQMKEVIVSPSNQKGKPLNEMAMVSARSISSEETNRFAGGFNDPARILSNFAGVNNSQDGSADIIVRGNSPKYLQWRLEGIQITNPSHFADPGGLGSNGISTLNNNILATSDFYTGAFPAEFGDALSGVYDVRLRTGNNEKLEGILGVGIVGTDLTLEGPFNKGYGGSFIVNYRFTTVAIVDKLGLMPDLGGVPQFQDGAFKLVLPSRKLGLFSMFGLAGSSSIKFEDVNPGIWITPGDRGLQEEIQEDFNKRAYLINTGINHSVSIGKKSYLTTTLAYSQDEIRDEVFERFVQNKSVVLERDNFKSKINNNTYRANTTFNSKISAADKIQVGSKWALMNQKFDISYLGGNGPDRIPLANFDESISMLRNFVSWRHRFSDQVSGKIGLHNMNVLYNNKSTIEPRIAANWLLSPSSSLSVGYGMHSTMESVHNYFAKVQTPDGNYTEPNRNLDLLKAHHFVVGYEKELSPNLRAKAEVYYQYLYDLPVENSTTSAYSTINETLDIRYVDLVNKGMGYNYGLELSLERFFADHYYFLVNTTLFDSKYKALDGVLRNTAFNSNYLVKVLFGKEFTNLGKKQNKTFALNAKAFFGGGRRIIPLLRDSKGNLAVDPKNNQYWDHRKAYNKYLDDIYTLTLALSYKWSKPKRTNELFLNIDNLTNNKPRLSEYYDPAKPAKIGYVTPVGIFPNVMYRLYF